MDTTHALVRALVHSRDDYCNSVLDGQPKYFVNKLQSALRASARLVLPTALAAIPGKSAVQAVHSCLQVPPSNGTCVLE